ncbi:unnamed protein product [Arabidopsis halleri]
MRFGFRWRNDHFEVFSQSIFQVDKWSEKGCWLTQVELQRIRSLVRRFVVSQCVKRRM